jgi:hypothetical protein
LQKIDKNKSRTFAALKINNDMKYQMELEVEIADNKISFTEEFFESISFVRKVRTIAPSPFGVASRYKAGAFAEPVSADATPVKTKLSDKYRGVFSAEDAKSFDEHTRIMRAEWNSI